MVSNACQACPVGATNTAGDDPDEDNTYCCFAADAGDAGEEDGVLYEAVREYIDGGQGTSAASTYGYPINTWCVGAVENMDFIFYDTTFNEEINGWDVSSATTFQHMFESAISFDQDINSWDTSSATDLNAMFLFAAVFNQDINGWDVSKVDNFRSMFSSATSFDQDINSWNTGSATMMPGVFQQAAAFNQNINSWDVSNVAYDETATDDEYGGNLSGSFYAMFEGATSFNQDINTWDVSKAHEFLSMFDGATSFNQDINSWDTSSATALTTMLYGATSFNQDINSWDVSSVTTFQMMFSGATSFNQNLCAWGENLDEGVDPLYDNMFQAYDIHRPVPDSGCTFVANPSDQNTANGSSYFGPFCASQCAVSIWGVTVLCLQY